MFKGFFKKTEAPKPIKRHEDRKEKEIKTDRYLDPLEAWRKESGSLAEFNSKAPEMNDDSGEYAELAKSFNVVENSSEEFWNDGSVTNDPYDNYGELNYFSLLKRSGDPRFKELSKKNNKILNAPKPEEGYPAEVNINTPEGIEESANSEVKNQLEAMIEQGKKIRVDKVIKKIEVASQKQIERDNAREAKAEFRKIKQEAPEYTEQELDTIYSAYENYYRDFLLKLAQRRGDKEEFDRLGKLSGEMEVSGKIFKGEALKSSAEEYARYTNQEKIDQGQLFIASRAFLGRIQADEKFNCAKTFEFVDIKDERTDALRRAKMIYTFNLGDKISPVFQIVKKKSKFFDRNNKQEVLIYEIQFMPPFFDKFDIENKTSDRDFRVQKNKSA